MTSIRFIGDLHGKLWDYGNLITEVKNLGIQHTIQVGDFGVGFVHDNSEKILLMDSNLNPQVDRFIRGNHDDPGQVENWEGYIRDGHHDQELDAFFVGGAWSIDWQYRTPGLSWWPDEEVSEYELEVMVDRYKQAKPKIMVTHDCPDSVARYLFDFYKEDCASRTRVYLEKMFEEHQPELWVFGHWHRSKDKEINGTRFICLAELETFDYGLNKE